MEMEISDSWRSSAAMRARRVGDSDLVVSTISARERPDRISQMCMHDMSPAVASVCTVKSRPASRKDKAGGGIGERRTRSVVRVYAIEEPGGSEEGSGEGSSLAPACEIDLGSKQGASISWDADSLAVGMLDGTVDVYTLDPLSEEAMRNNNAPLKPSATFYSSRNPHSYGQFTWGGLLLEHQGASSVHISYNTGMLYALEGMRGGGRFLSWDMVKDDEESACWVPFAPGEPAPLSFSRSPLGGTFAVGGGGGSFAVADQRILGQGGDRGTVARVEGAHAGGVNSVAWGRFGASWLATGGQDGIIKVWDVRMLNGGGSEAFRLSWHTGGVTSLDWSHAHPEVLCSGGGSQVVFWNLNTSAEHVLASTRALSGAPFRSRIASSLMSSHSPFDLVAASVTGEVAAVRIKNGLLRPTALSCIPSILKDYAGGAGGVDKKQGKALLKLIQGVAVRGYARDFVAASEHMGFLVEDLVIHGKLEEAMSLLEMSVPHYLIEEYNDDDDGDGSGGNGGETVGKLTRYTKAPEKPPKRDIREELEASNGKLPVLLKRVMGTQVDASMQQKLCQAVVWVRCSLLAKAGSATELLSMGQSVLRHVREVVEEEGGQGGHCWPTVAEEGAWVHEISRCVVGEEGDGGHVVDGLYLMGGISRVLRVGVDDAESGEFQEALRRALEPTVFREEHAYVERDGGLGWGGGGAGVCPFFIAEGEEEVHSAKASKRGRAQLSDYDCVADELESLASLRRYWSTSASKSGTALHVLTERDAQAVLSLTIGCKISAVIAWRRLEAMLALGKVESLVTESSLRCAKGACSQAFRAKVHSLMSKAGMSSLRAAMQACAAVDKAKPWQVDGARDGVLILAGILTDADLTNLPVEFAPYIAEQCQEFKIVLKKALHELFTRNKKSSHVEETARGIREDIEGKLEEGGDLGPESQRDLLDPIIEILLEFE